MTVFDKLRHRRDDEGSVLLITMFFLIMGSVLVLPILDRVNVAHKNGQVSTKKNAREEAVKGAVRIALAKPEDLYEVCSANSGLHVSQNLPTVGMDIATDTRCTTVKNTTQQAESELRIALALTTVGATNPFGMTGSPYSDGIDETTWVSDSTPASVPDKILLPQLANRGGIRSAVPFDYPYWGCKVFFPGNYPDPINITGSDPVYFASGIYYFQNTITISGSANVVVGNGASGGCVSDTEAALDINLGGKPHNITGAGATFIFGGAGRLVVNNSVAGSGPVVEFNNRLVNEVEVGELPSRNVSIMTVNGGLAGSSFTDLAYPGFMFVPRSTTPSNANLTTASGFTPSTLAVAPSPAVDPLPVIDINLTSASAAKVWIPGQVAVPQGIINIAVAPGMAGTKQVSIVGGVLAAKVTQTPDQPETTQVGMANRVVQKTFKIVSTTVSGSPKVEAVALIQINETGEYVVNSFEVHTLASS